MNSWLENKLSLNSMSGQPLNIQTLINKYQLSYGQCINLVNEYKTVEAGSYKDALKIVINQKAAALSTIWAEWSSLINSQIAAVNV